MLEVLADSLKSAIIAEEAGADRIELCASMIEGGITPSIGLINLVCNSVSIPVYVMIRPRAGDFVYSSDELSIMEKDIESIKKTRAAGVVLGILTKEGNVDTIATEYLVKQANPLGVTFHRAFDQALDPQKALEDIISAGCERVLSSGQMDTAIQGIELLEILVKQSKKRIHIMAGSGVNSSNIEEILTKTRVKEIHSSAKKEDESASNNSVSVGYSGKIKRYLVDKNEVAKMATLLKSVHG